MREDYEITIIGRQTIDAQTDEIQVDTLGDYTERGGAQQFLACCLSILRHSIARDFSSRKTIDHAQRVVQAYERIAANGNVRLQLTELSL